MGIVYAAELVAITCVAVPVMVSQWRRLRTSAVTAERHTSPLVIRYSVAYLAVMAVLWLASLPAYFGAVNGITANGDPIGTLWYVAACFLVAGGCAAAAATATPGTYRPSDLSGQFAVSGDAP
jgi:hypothetical protein